MSLVKEIIKIAQDHERTTGVVFEHLNNFRGAHRYVRDARYINRESPRASTVLDLGCGAGQMSYLLQRMGYRVTAVDLSANDVPHYIAVHNRDESAVPIVYRSLNVLDEQSYASDLKGPFDCICLSGVLEHVVDPGRFLRKIRHLLKHQGALYIFRFPNRTSWIEKINDARFGLDTDHPLRFTRAEVDFMLRWHGFRVHATAYEELFPVNLRGLPPAVVGIFRLIDPMLIPLSWLLCRIPFIRLLSTSFRFKCTKAFDEVNMTELRPQRTPRSRDENNHP